VIPAMQLPAFLQTAGLIEVSGRALRRGRYMPGSRDAEIFRKVVRMSTILTLVADSEMTPSLIQNAVALKFNAVNTTLKYLRTRTGGSSSRKLARLPMLDSSRISARVQPALVQI